MEEEIMTTKRFFKSHNINLLDYWLESCIQWCREENPCLNDSLESLHLKVYAQWLLLDLRDVEVPILPQNISQQKKLTLNEIYTLQLLHIIDISCSKLSQIEKIRSGIAASSDLTVDENNPQKSNSSGKRMLKMLLTDGVQNIETIEYQTINVLNINLKPGTKIKITGPVTVRRGQMLLEEKHVRILGGEVEELLISNAPENVLARALNLPENPNPNLNVEETEAVTNPRRNTTVAQVPVLTDPSKDIKIKQRVANRSQQSVITSYLIDKQNETIANNKRQSTNDDGKTKQINRTFITQEEESRINAEVDMLLEAERDMAEEYPFIISESPDIFENFEANINREIEKKQVEKQHPFVQQNKSTDENNSSASTSKFAEKMDISMFEDMDIDIDAHLDLIDQQIDLIKNKSKLVTIKDLLNRTDRINNEYTIKAKFKTVLQKLTVRNDKWFLKLLIGDETGDMEVQLQSEIITNSMGYSPSAMMVLKNNMNDDENAKIAVMEIIEELKQKVLKIDCEMVIKYISHGDCPNIVKLKTGL